MAKVIIGVTGGIAAYKACELIRLLKKADHEVRVVMTDCAKQFIGETTFAALSENSVYGDAMSIAKTSMLHIELAKWADKLLIAPASAATISALAHGDATKLLTTLCLATQSPCYIAPAMNQSMWHHPAVQENIKKLVAFGYNVLHPEVGFQACGDHGIGRMPEPEHIIASVFKKNQPLANVNVLVTAGPTYEKIDPIRYIGNISSGKMGYAMAKAFSSRGANVVLISGPTALQAPPGVIYQSVFGAEEMFEAVNMSISGMDIFVCAAAIANYSTSPSQIKIKSSKAALTLRLQKTRDILQETADNHKDIFCVGFCAESEKIIELARAKLDKKGCQAIIANLIASNGAPFGSEENEAFYLNHSDTFSYGKKHKQALADTLVTQIITDFQASRRDHSQCQPNSVLPDFVLP